MRLTFGNEAILTSFEDLIQRLEAKYFTNYANALPCRETKNTHEFHDLYFKANHTYCMG